MTAATTSPHWPGLPPDVNVILNDSYQATQLAVADSVRLRMPALLVGPSGSGKTFAVTMALQQQAVDWVKYRADHRPKGNALLESCLRLVGEPLPAQSRQRTQETLTHLLTAALMERPRVLWIDEAQNMSTESLRQLRHIIDTDGMPSTVLLSGESYTTKLLANNEKPLLSRCARRVGFQLLDPKTTLIPTLRAYHPVYANSQAKLIHRLDDLGAYGRFREYAKVLEAVSTHYPDRDRLDDTIVRTVAMMLWAR